MSTPMTMTNCPTEETLAAFIDGRLDPEARQRIVEHMGTCEDCYSLVSAAWDLQAEEKAAVAPAPVVVQGRFGSRGLWSAAAASFAAAAAVALVFLYAPLHDRLFPPKTGMGALARAAAIVSDRIIEPRLSGGFVFRPKHSDMRGPRESEDAQKWRIMRVASDAEAAVKINPTPANLQTYGAAKLLLGDREEAVRRLEEALRRATGETDVKLAARKTKDAHLLSDLSAAYYVRWRFSGASVDLMRAADCASLAYEIDPASPEIAWNRAVALTALENRAAAMAAWRDYLKIDASSPWALEARGRLEELEKPPLSRLWDRDKPALLDAARRHDASRTRELVRLYPEQSRLLVEEELLAQWSELRSRGDRPASDAALAIAREIARAINDGPGDAMAFDAVTAAAAADAAVETALMEGHREYSAGRRLYRAARYRDAQQHLRTAMAALERGGSALHFRAAMYTFTTELYLGDTDAALSHGRGLLTALAPHARTYPSVTGQMRWTCGLGAMSKGYLDDALSNHVAAFEAFQQSGETSNLAGLAQAISDDYRDVGDINKAWTYQLRAIELADTYAAFERAHVVINGAALSAMRDGFTAVAAELQSTVIDGARASREPLYICDALLRAGEIDAARGRNASARAHINEALAVWSAIPESDSKTRLRADAEMDRATAMDDLPPAAQIAALDRALTYVKEDRVRFARALLLRSRARVSAGDAAAAERDLNAGIAAVEAERANTASDETRREFLATGAGLYKDLVRLLISRNATEVAFDVTERARARWLLDRFTGEESAAAAPLMTWRELQRRIPDRTAVVSFVVGDRIDVLIATNDTLRHVPLAAKIAEVAEEIAALRTSIADGNDKECTRLASLLYEQLLVPIRSDLADAEMVAVVPDAALNGVPFAALIDPHSGRYLVEDLAVVTTPSANVFVRALQRRNTPTPADGPALVVANPSLSGDDEMSLETLSAASEEGTRVAARLPRATLLHGADATVERVMNASLDAATIHFASHGVSNPQRPELSALLLARDPSGRSRLTAQDIYRLKLPRTRLVVLAACESGYGESSTDAPLTLASAFLAAGVPEVVASLWRVDDASAAALVDDFYDHLRTGSDPVNALRAAQLSAIRAGTGDMTWAAFQVIGS